MTVDPVVLALQAAIKANDSVELRNALGKHLLSTGYPQQAFNHFEKGLILSPTNIDTLQGVIQAASESGQTEKATTYQLVLSSLTPSKKIPITKTPSTENKQNTFLNTQQKDPSQDQIIDFHGTSLQTKGKPNLQLVQDEQVEEPTIQFADVGGLDEVKKRIHRAFILPLQRPALYARYGKQIGGGLLLYGPPGCGKTFMAKAVAGEIGARFMNIGISEILDMYLGNSEKRLHKIFETARAQAPTVLFFDEVDALGQRRTQLRNSSMRNVVNQLLTELDGMKSDNQKVFVLGATNQPWDLDTAIRRPGRFDRLLFIPPPDLTARKTILSLKLANRPTSTELNLDLLAQRTEGYSGADLEAIVNLATELAIEKTIETDTDTLITNQLLFTALSDIQSSTRPWLETARNFARYANEGGVYDDLHAYLRQVGLG